MSKKVIGIAAVIVAFIAIIVAVFMLNQKEPPIVDSPQDIAKAAHENDPSKSVDEWLEVGNQELTEEQQQVAKEILIDNVVPEMSEITDVNPDTNEVTFIDVDGNEWVMEADSEIANMTDEEARAYTQQLLDSLGNDNEDDLRVDFGSNSVNFPSNTQGNQGQPQVDTNYEDVEINKDDGLDWSSEEATSATNGNYDPDADAWNPYEGMTPEEKEAAIKADQEATQKAVDGITGSMS